jgi:hypothetical protein
LRFIELQRRARVSRLLSVAFGGEGCGRASTGGFSMRVSLFVALVVALGFATPSRADKIVPPRSYKVASADGKFVFVMLLPKAASFEGYTRSGLYKKGADEPLWTVDWYARHVAVCSDGVHVVRFGGPHGYEERLNPDRNKRVVTQKDLKKEALTIFARGKRVKEFAIGDLVEGTEGVRKGVTFILWKKGSKIVDDKKQLEIVTLDGARILIDLPTGKVVERKKPE